MREKVTAVCDLNLDIGRHEVFGLLGPNGSGKSTTLKMILGLMFPPLGRISVFDRSPNDVKTKARIGFLPEESHLYPFLNAYETLDFYGQLFHQPRRQRRHRIEMLLDMVGLSSVAYRRIGEYSKGMQRRIGLAQALINDPDLLILDEPNLREVIAFPMNQRAQDLMMNAPNEVTDKQLEELSIRIIPPIDS